MMLEQHFLLSALWLYVFHLRHLCFLERRFIGVLMFLLDIFFTKFQINFWLVLDFIFVMKVLKEDLLASLMV